MSYPQIINCTCCTGNQHNQNTTVTNEDQPPQYQEPTEPNEPLPSYEEDEEAPPTYRRAAENAQPQNIASTAPEFEEIWTSLIHSLHTEWDSKWCNNVFMKYYQWRLSRAKTTEKRDTIFLQSIGQALKENYYRHRWVVSSLGGDKICKFHDSEDCFCSECKAGDRLLYYNWRSHFGKKEMEFF